MFAVPSISVLRIPEAFLPRMRQATVTSKFRLLLVVVHHGKNIQGTRPLRHQPAQDIASLSAPTAAKSLLDRIRMWYTRALLCPETPFSHLQLRGVQVPLPEGSMTLPVQLQVDQAHRPEITRMEVLHRPLQNPMSPAGPLTIATVLLPRPPILTGTIPGALIIVHPHLSGRLPVGPTRLLVLPL